MADYEVRDDIKGVLRTLSKKTSDLSRELKINYDTLCAYINGRRAMPPEVEIRISEVLNKWSNGI